MKMAGYTQDTLAVKMDVSQATVSRWENGVVPHRRTRENLADLLGVAVDDLMNTPELTAKSASKQLLPVAKPAPAVHITYSTDISAEEITALLEVFARVSEEMAKVAPVLKKLQTGEKI